MTLGTGQVVTIVRDLGEDVKQVCSVSNHDDLCLMLKYVGLGNAAGNIGNPCFIMACDALKGDVFFVREVDGLSSSTSTPTPSFLLTPSFQVLLTPPPRYRWIK